MTATRRQAREWAIQMLTAADLNPPDDLLVAMLAFWRQVKSLDVDDGGSGGEEVRGKLRTFTEERVRGVYEGREEIDRELQPFLESWEIARLGTVERAVLRMGAWELKNTDIPVPVVINEAVDLVNWYSTPKARALVNSTLDRYAKEVRGERERGNR